MNQARFDDLTRALATGRLSRRQMLKGLAAGLVGAMLGSAPLNMRARPALATGTSCAKQVYSKGTNFRGEPITADVQFFDSLDSIDQCARSNNVFIYVTNSYREPGTIVKPIPGVKQAKPGNHNAGHAIDMNVQCDGCGPNGHCDSKCLGKTLPQPVQSFIDCVKAAGLYWGGDFRTKDPVHIDDGLKETNKALFEERVTAMSVSGPCPDTEICDASGVCTDGQTGGCNVTCDPPKVPNPDKNCDCECPGQSCVPPRAINPDTCVCECQISCPGGAAPDQNCECPSQCLPGQTAFTVQTGAPALGTMSAQAAEATVVCCEPGTEPCGTSGECCPSGQCDAATGQCTCAQTCGECENCEGGTCVPVSPEDDKPCGEFNAGTGGVCRVGPDGKGFCKPCPELLAEGQCYGFSQSFPFICFNWCPEPGVCAEDTAGGLTCCPEWRLCNGTCCSAFLGQEWCCPEGCSASSSSSSSSSSGASCTPIVSPPP